MGSPYYVKNGGNDALDGFSDATAWASLTKVNSMSFAAGDTVLFRRAHTFWIGTGYGLRPASNGSTGSPITFGAYGVGDDPIITGGVDLSATGAWAEQGGAGSHIWRSTGLTVEVGELFFNNDALFGNYHYAADLPLTAQGDFYYNAGSDYLEVYSVGNPGTFYSHIEASTGDLFDAHGNNSSRLNGRSYITIGHLQFKHNAGNGLELFNTTHHVTVEYCSFFGNGGGDAYDGNRDGNHIQSWNSVNNLTIRYNTFDHSFETAVSLQGMDVSVAVSNVYIYGNVMKDCTCAMDFWYYNQTGTISGVYFCHNVVYNTRNVYTPSYRSVPRGVSLAPYSITPTGCHMQNNIFHTVAANRGYIYMNAGGDAGWTIDNNCYYPNATNMFIEAPNGYATIAAWRSATGQDAHSIAVDPLFAAAPTDFHLGALSPCIDTGAVSGVPWVADNAVEDMGAYEFPHPVIGGLKRCPFRRP